MRRLLLATMLASPVAHASDLTRPTTAMLYWQKPLGAQEKRDAASAFGFRLDRAHVMQSVAFSKPIVDVRFNGRGFHSLAFRGAVLHQNQPASGGTAETPNWWVIGGVAAAAAIVIHDDNRKSRSQSVPSAPASPAAVSPAPVITIIPF